MAVAVTTTMPIDEVQFVKELYPRLREDDAAIERYRASLDLLPPIVVARGRVLTDGFHRWQAFRREGRTEIPFEDLGNLTDVEILTESIRRNATHGQQLSQPDKRRLAGQLWPGLEKDGRVAYLADLLSVTTKSIENWTKEARTQERRSQQAMAWDLWLNCREYRDIETEMGVPKSTVEDWVSEKRKLSEFGQPPESRQHFDIWQFQNADKDAGSQSYFGAIPPQVVENLLWFYTEPGDIVVDPFAGSGTTIDVAKRMGRRVWASDRRGNEYAPLLPIHQHDITAGWPDDAPRKANLILLDPPYWQQAKGRYSQDDSDLGNMGLDQFYVAWQKVIVACAEHLVEGGRIAYIISPTQCEDGTVVDHASTMFVAACTTRPNYSLQIERRIIVPYQTQQATGQQVEWARANKRMLKLYRDLVVLSK